MLDIIIVAFVGLFIFLRLKSELGNRNDEDLMPPSTRHSHPSAYPADDAGAEGPAPAAIPDMADKGLHETLQSMHRLNRDFSVGGFTGGATTAYQMILEAFWSGDSETLQQFLSPSVFEQFNGAVTEREKNGHTLENKILDITESDITAATLEGSTAEITVAFNTELIAVTRDKDGNAISGNLSDGITVEDTWTFSRDLKSNNPSWFLVATRAG